MSTRSPRPLRLESLEDRNMMTGEQPISPTVADLQASFAEDITAYVQALEEATLQTELATANAELQPFQVQADTARISLDQYLQKNLYQRSSFNAYPRLDSIPASQQPAFRSLLSQHEQIMGSLLQQGRQYNEYLAQGNRAAADSVFSNIDQTCFKYTRYTRLTRTTYAQGQEMGRNGMIIPSSGYAITQEAAKIAATEARLRSEADTASATLHTTSANRDSITQTLLSGNYDVRRQAQEIDGNTPEEIAAVDTIFEDSVDLGVPFVLDEMQMRTGSRVTRNENSIIAKMTEQEFADLLSDISNAVVQSDGTHSSVRQSIQTMLDANEPVRAILEKSIDAAAAPEVSPLASDISTALERAAEIGHARMVVSAVGDSTGQTVSVRFRNPGAESYVFIKYVDDSGYNYLRDGFSAEHPEGLADGSYSFRLKRGPFIGSGTGDIIVELWDSPQRTKLLDRSALWYDDIGNRLVVKTEQPDWNESEEGRLEAVPIEPAMSVSKISGNNVLLAMQSPHDQTVLSFESGGLLDTQRVMHEGGSAFSMAQVTFNAGKPSGTYTLKMYDRGNGMVLDEMAFNWDAGSKQLSLVDGSDVFAGAEGQTDLLAGYTETFDAVNALSGATFDNALCTRILQDQLLRQSSFYFDNAMIDQLIYAEHPEWKPENIEAEVDRKWREQFPTFPRSSVQDWVYEERKMFMENAHLDLEYYGNAMMRLMQQAADALIQLRQGGNQTELSADLTEAINYAQGMPLQTANQIQARHIGNLKGYGITVPGMEKMFAETREVLDQIWTEVARLQQEVVQHREYMNRMMEDGWSLKADGTWVRTSPYTREETQDLVRVAVARAQRIQDLINNSNDPRIRALRTAQERNVIALAVGSSNEPMTDENVQRTMDDTFEVMEDMEDLGVGGADPNDPNYTRNALTFVKLRREVGTEGIGTLYTDTINRYQFNADECKTTIQNTTIWNRTSAGRIFLGLYQDAFSQTDEDMKRMFVEAERITGINAIRLWNAARNRNYLEFFAFLKLSFEEKGFAHIFDEMQQPSLNYNELHKVTSTQDAVGTVHLSFDISGFDLSYDHAAIYLVGLDGQTVNGDQPIMDMRGQLATDITMSQINSVLPYGPMLDGYRLKVAVWKSSEAGAPGLQGNFLSDAIQVKNLEANTGALEHLSDDPVENAIMNIVSHNFPLDNPSGRYVLLGSGFHDGAEYNAYDINDKDGGDSDRGDVLYSMAPGFVRIGKYSSTDETKFGSIIIEHSIEVNGQQIQWRSGYLHVPLFKTDRTVDVENVAKAIYEVRYNENVIELWDGKEVGGHEPIGYVGGRDGYNEDGSYDEGWGNAHAHVFAQIGSKSIDLHPVFELDSIGLKDIRAFDAGADGKWRSNEDNRTLNVAWNDNEQAFLNTTENVMLDRNEQVPMTPGVETVQYWMAWHNDPNHRRRVTWLNIGTPNAPLLRWITFDPVEAGKDVWNPVTKTWATRAESLQW